MKTPAQEAGFVVGGKYRTKDTSWVGGGHVVTFVEDDGSECPMFRGPSTRNGVGFYEALSKLEPVEEPKVDPAAVHVSLNGNSTTIVVQRNLTADEVAAVLKAINAA